MARVRAKTKCAGRWPASRKDVLWYCPGVPRHLLRGPNQRPGQLYFEETLYGEKNTLHPPAKQAIDCGTVDAELARGRSDVAAVGIQRSPNEVFLHSVERAIDARC